MNHNHNNTNKKEMGRKPDCVCGNECSRCSAEELSVTCGCNMEAKQYEYAFDEKLKHQGCEHKTSAPSEENGELIYTCPMHPEVQKHEPGKCPGCGMELIPQKKKGKNVADHASHNVRRTSHADHHAAMKSPEMAKEMEKDMRRRFFISLILAIPIFLYSPAGVGILKTELPSPIPTQWLLFILATPVVFWMGSIFITGTYYSLKARKLNMSVLIAFGVLTTYFASAFIFLSGGEETFFEAGAMLVTFVIFGHWMEMKSRRGTSDALRALFDLVPPRARAIRNGVEVSILSAEVVVGDIIVLKPGDKVPVDGEITEGETTIDEALVTGESLPVIKKIGDKVTGGSINQNGTVKFRARAVGSNMVLTQIIKLVEKAQNSKAPGQRIADKAASWLVVIAILAGLATFFVWYFLVGASFLQALTFAVAVVVITCPDSLGLATPTAVAVGTGLGAKHGILFKDAITLEGTAKINSIIFDKTGTLTEGKPKVTEVVARSGFDRNEVLSLAAAAERGSNHPISMAILDEIKKNNLQVSEKVEKFEAIGGHGVRAIVNGKIILAGTERLMQQNNIDLSSMREEIDRLLHTGNTISIVAVNGQVAGVLGVADVIRESAKKSISALKSLGLEVAMITGDHEQVAKAVSQELGIDRYFAQVLPEDKAKYVKKLQDEGKFVAMVGDGINDAPALAQANIGIAIGAGTDVAIETGNIVLMKSDPYDVIAAIRLSKATVGKMKQNLIWAATYNTIALPIAAGVLYPLGFSIRPEFAALLMSGDSLAVAINAVLLKRVESKLKV